MDARRVDYLDVVNGIGIVCVVLGHIGDEAVRSVIYPFYMPLFFIISGYFLKSNKSFNIYVKEKFIRLSQPYVYTCVCNALIIMIKGFDNFYSSFGTMLHYIIDALYGVGNWGYSRFVIFNVKLCMASA